jgi:hypothetical protein
MDRADFIHLVRLSEQASAQDGGAYRRSVVAFAALGYAWVVGCLLLAAAIVSFCVGAIMRGQFKAAMAGALLAAGGLFIASLRALWCRLDEPDGVLLSPADAPALFDALERIRARIKGPPIHRVRLDGDFNASISQHPRFGLFGGAINNLTIGLPLLMAVDRSRFLAVLAHEYGHLRGNHGRFAAWIYRTRLSWAKLNDGLRGDDGPIAAATQAFLRWYFPRFSAKTFALARQDEYEADRISGELLGRETAGAALTEIAIKGAWLRREFWPTHWSAAAGSALPIGPYAAMGRLLALPPEDSFARESLRQALRQISDVEDTHPVLRERLDALEVGTAVPDWSTKPAIELLGKSAPQWIAHFDKRWCKGHASSWKERHAYLARVQARAGQLDPHAPGASAGEIVEFADLQRRLQARAELKDLYEKALEAAPAHPGALRGLIRCLASSDQKLRMKYLGQLFEHSPADRRWACRMAVSALEQPAPDGSHDDQALKLWRERLKQAGEAEERAWDEMTGTPFFQSIARHDLSEFEAAQVQAGLARCKPVARAWLVRKNLREFPQRRCYLVFLELPQLDDEERYDLCRSLERSLDLPGPALLLWAGSHPTLADIQKNAFQPVFTRMGQSGHAS